MSLSPLKEDINVTPTSPSKYTNRSHTCGELGSKNIGENVTLSGWLEFQRMGKFIVLRDGYGRVQLLVKENASIDLKFDQERYVNLYFRIEKHKLYCQPYHMNQF